MAEQFAGHFFLSGTGRVKNGDGVAAKHVDHFHGRDVRLSVSKVNHVGDGDAFLFVRAVFVHFVGVAGGEDSFLDFEKVLGFGREVHRNPGPFGLPVFIIQVAAGKHMLEFLGNGRTFNDFRQARGVDVVLHNHAFFTAVFVYQAKPFLHAIIELDIGSVAVEVFPG